jgi:hypothetical protein
MMLMRCAIGLPISACLLAVACRNLNTKQKPQPLVEVFYFGDPGATSPQGLISAIIDGFKNHDTNPNKHALGLRPLLHFNPQSWIRTGLRASQMPSEATQFLNFGSDGFLLATLDPNKSLRTLSIYSTQKVLPPPEFGPQPSSIEGNPSENTIKHFSPSAQHLATNAVLGTETSCIPLGAHKAQEVFFATLQNGLGCVLSRRPDDLRFPNENFKSTLACFNETKRTFWNTHLDKTQFLFPLSNVELLAYEGGYSPPRMTRIHLETAEQTEQQRPQQDVLETKHSPTAAIPEELFGVYECSQNTTRITPNDVATTPQKSYYFIDKTIFLGLREPRPASDAIWHVSLNSENLLSTQRLSWTQAAAFLPGFNDYPAPICVTKSVVDVKCALATLQMAARLAFENLSEKSPDTGLRAQKSLLAFNLLHTLQQKMGRWLLDLETWKFMQLFASDALTLSQTVSVPIAELQTAKTFLENTEPTFEKKNPEAHKALRGYLNVPEPFWEALTSPVK